MRPIPERHRLLQLLPDVCSLEWLFLPTSMSDAQFGAWMEGCLTGMHNADGDLGRIVAWH